MQFDAATCRWSIVGTLGGAADIRMSDERRRVLQALADAGGPMSSEQIRRAANLKTRSAADKMLCVMVQDGQVTRIERGKYILPGDAGGKEGKKDRHGNTTH